jgi:mono/diheme cytochrome c family protein
MEISLYTRTLWAGCAGVAMCIIIFDPLAVLAESDAERGLALASRRCNSCHVVQQNDPGMDDGEFGPPFASFTQYTPEMLKRLFAAGHADMDALSRLSDDDLAAIAAHLHRLKPEPKSR